ncbi:hypothetical protein niasHT_034494 [Heterodera trifolii]|uniref:Uncharacterized protein n=1 Tax=Heterodera trifolii TaxID=157864 RepID=A0ABD2HQ53_9BILA
MLSSTVRCADCSFLAFCHHKWWPNVLQQLDIRPKCVPSAIYEFVLQRNGQPILCKCGRSPVQLSVPLAHGAMEVMLCFHGQPTTTWEQQAWMMPSSSFSANQMPFQFGGFSADAAQRKTGQSVQNVAAPQMGPSAATATGGGSTLEQQPTAVGRVSHWGGWAPLEESVSTANSSPSLITPKPTNTSSSFSSSSSSFSSSFAFSSPSPSSPQSTAAITLTIPTATTSLAGTDPPKAKNSSPSYFKKILNGLWG